MPDKQGLLLSGGMDSISLAYWLRPAVAYTIDYGQQPAEAEIRASKAVTRALKIKHEVIRVDCRSLGSGDLAGRPAIKGASSSEWWPYRNQLLVTIAATKAVQAGLQQLAVGCLSTDRGHIDGRASFIRAMDRLLSIQEGGLRLVAPAIRLTAATLVRKSGIPLDLLAWAHSCHTSNLACGHCRGCNKHWQVYAKLKQNPY